MLIFKVEILNDDDDEVNTIDLFVVAISNVFSFELSFVLRYNSSKSFNFIFCFRFGFLIFFFLSERWSLQTTIKKLELISLVNDQCHKPLAI